MFHWITLARLLALSEAAHAILHGKVLLSIGTLYTVEELEKKRDYFVWDLASVATSCLYLIFLNRVNCTTMILTGLHNLLHMYYIINWTRKKNSFIVSIREWSAEADIHKRMQKGGKPMFIYNTLGTLFDMTVHLYMVHRLSSG